MRKIPLQRFKAIHLSALLAGLISLSACSSMPAGSNTVEQMGNGRGPSQPQMPTKEVPAPVINEDKAQDREAEQRRAEAEAEARRQAQARREDEARRRQAEREARRKAQEARERAANQQAAPKPSRPTTSAPPAPPSPPVPPPTQNPGTTDLQYPAFKWPPPKPSAHTEVPLSILGINSNNVANLNRLNRAIRSALERGEYFDTSYYRIPDQDDGFVLVTRLEKITPEGGILESNERWPKEIKRRSDFNLSNYLTRLFYADEGLYRIIAFVVTSRDIPSWAQAVTAKESKQWISEGAPALKRSIAAKNVTDSHKVFALIYEFAKGCDDCTNQKTNDVMQLIPGSIQSRKHLQQARIWHDETD